VAQDRVQWGSLVDRFMIFQVPRKTEISWPASLLCSQEELRSIRLF